LRGKPPNGKGKGGEEERRKGASSLFNSPIKVRLIRPSVRKEKEVYWIDSVCGSAIKGGERRGGVFSDRLHPFLGKGNLFSGKKKKFYLRKRRFRFPKKKKRQTETSQARLRDKGERKRKRREKKFLNIFIKNEEKIGRLSFFERGRGGGEKPFMNTNERRGGRKKKKGTRLCARQAVSCSFLEKKKERNEGRFKDYPGEKVCPTLIPMKERDQPLPLILSKEKKEKALLNTQGRF